MARTAGSRLALLLLPVVVALGGAGTPAAARVPRRGGPGVSELVVDQASGAVLYERDPDAPRRPASLTKMMTLYLAFDALERGRLRLDDPVPVSRHAASQPASRLGLVPGRSLPVRTALAAIAVDSANDVAVALAERLAGSERRFAAAMTVRAHQLGLRHTRFANATGLTDPGNVTTASDIATLAGALLAHHPRDYAWFGTRAIVWRSRRLPNHNHLLGRVPGVDGIKTGYTADAGYNLAASARRRGRRIVVVVLGERSVAARDARVANLLEIGFAPPRPAVRGGARRTVAQHRARSHAG